MASVIRVLPPEVANRIAAGEVVERPASVVKELVENALDAGARHLQIDLEDGGVRLVRVGDDGEGMGPEDLARCVLPHATSKIATVDDLFRVATFGFRGEALPSIASVSETTILSRRAENALGARLVCRGGTMDGPTPAGAPAGTTVEVRNLFFNVPARRKFLKQERTELAHCVEAVTRLLLADPEVGVRVTHNGRKVIEVDPDHSFRARVRSLFGPGLGDRLLEAAAEDGDLRIAGFVGPPSLVKANAEQQYFFLNGRFIRDRNLGFALKDSYRGLVMPKDFPVGFLCLGMDPAAVDVNVHPTKIEVRFRDRDRVLALVRRAVRGAVHGAAGDRPLDLGRSAVASASAGRIGAPASRKELLGRIERELFPDGVPAASAAAEPGDRVAEADPDRTGIAAPAALEAVAAAVPAAPPRRRSSPCSGHPSADREVPTGVPRTWLQIHRSYIAVEGPDGLRIIDQHALHERRLYDELQERCARGAVETQRLLVPEVVELTAVEQARVLDHAQDLADLGVEVEGFGGTSVCVRALPVVLSRLPGEDAVRQVLEILAEGGPGLERRELQRQAMADLACRAAVKFGDALPGAEIAALLEWWERHPEAGNCPHGRPVAVSVSLRDLEAQFDRKR